MKITCHACDAKYTIADEKVTGRTVKIKCKKCGATIVVNADQPAGAYAGAPGYEQPHGGGGDDDGLGSTRVMGGDMHSPAAMEWTVVLGEEERTMNQLQIAEEMQRGTITAETYVWRDGMPDWLPVLQIAELAALLVRVAPPQAAPVSAPAGPGAVQDEPGLGLAGTIVMTDSPMMSPFAAASAPRPAAGVAATPAPAAVVSPAPAVAAASPANQPAAARRANRPGGSVDVFAAAAEGQQPREPERPKPPSPHKLGERNENSVLFSLSALTATENAAAKSKGDEAVLDLGMGGGRGNGKGGIDDLMNIGGGAIGGPMLAPPPLLAPVVEAPPPPAPAPVAMAMPAAMGPASMPMPMPQQKSKTGLIIGIIAAVVVIGGVGVFFAIGGSGAGSGATTDNSGAATTSSAPATTSAAPATTTSAAPSATDTPSGAPAASSAVVASNDSKTPSSGSGGGPAPKSTGAPSSSASATKTAEPAPTQTTAPSATTSATSSDTGGGGRDFNKGAATTALAAAASAAKGCKQAGGPTGSASVRVVFAPSGNVTSANVQGPPFAGTPVGGCIAAAFRGAHVPPFDGSPVAVSKTVNIN